LSERISVTLNFPALQLFRTKPHSIRHVCY